jgi:hypothetical protein
MGWLNERCEDALDCSAGRGIKNSDEIAGRQVEGQPAMKTTGAPISKEQNVSDNIQGTILPNTGATVANLRR